MIGEKFNVSMEKLDDMISMISDVEDTIKNITDETLTKILNFDFQAIGEIIDEKVNNITKYVKNIKDLIIKSITDNFEFLKENYNSSYPYLIEQSISSLTDLINIIFRQQFSDLQEKTPKFLTEVKQNIDNCDANFFDNLFKIDKEKFVELKTLFNGSYNAEQILEKQDDFLNKIKEKIMNSTKQIENNKIYNFSITELKNINNQIKTKIENETFYPSLQEVRSFLNNKLNLTKELSHDLELWILNYYFRIANEYDENKKTKDNIIEKLKEKKDNIFAVIEKTFNESMEKIEAFKEMDFNFERVRNILGDIFNITNVKEELHNIIEIIKEQVESLNISGLIEKIDSVNDKIVTPLLEKIDVKKMEELYNKTIKLVNRIEYYYNNTDDLLNKKNKDLIEDLDELKEEFSNYYNKDSLNNTFEKFKENLTELYNVIYEINTIFKGMSEEEQKEIFKKYTSVILGKFQKLDGVEEKLYSFIGTNITQNKIINDFLNGLKTQIQKISAIINETVFQDQINQFIFNKINDDDEKLEIVKKFFKNLINYNPMNSSKLKEIIQILSQGRSNISQIVQKVEEIRNYLQKSVDEKTQIQNILTMINEKILINIKDENLEIVKEYLMGLIIFNSSSNSEEVIQFLSNLSFNISKIKQITVKNNNNTKEIKEEIQNILTMINEKVLNSIKDENLEIVKEYLKNILNINQTNSSKIEEVIQILSQGKLKISEIRQKAQEIRNIYNMTKTLIVSIQNLIKNEKFKELFNKITKDQNQLSIGDIKTYNNEILELVSIVELYQEIKNITKNKAEEKIKEIIENNLFKKLSGKINRRNEIKDSINCKMDETFTEDDTLTLDKNSFEFFFLGNKEYSFQIEKSITINIGKNEINCKSDMINQIRSIYTYKSHTGFKIERTKKRFTFIINVIKKKEFIEPIFFYITTRVKYKLLKQQASKGRNLNEEKDSEEVNSFCLLDNKTDPENNQFNCYAYPENISEVDEQEGIEIIDSDYISVPKNGVNNFKKKSETKLSSGAIVGIILGTLFVLAIIIASVFYIKKNKKTLPKEYDGSVSNIKLSNSTNNNKYILNN